MQFGKNPFNGFLAACKILRPAMRTIFLEACVCCAVMAGSATWRRWLPLTHIGVINGLHGVGWKGCVITLVAQFAKCCLVDLPRLALEAAVRVAVVASKENM